jgi:hypothetical protein
VGFDGWHVEQGDRYLYRISTGAINRIWLLFGPVKAADEANSLLGLLVKLKSHFSFRKTSALVSSLLAIYTILVKANGVVSLPVNVINLTKLFQEPDSHLVEVVVKLQADNDVLGMCDYLESQIPGIIDELKEFDPKRLSPSVEPKLLAPGKNKLLPPSAEEENGQVADPENVITPEQVEQN